MDFTTKDRVVEMKSPVVCRCPYCGREVREAQRLRYPETCAQAFAAVYRCNGCRRHIGAPMAQVKV